MPFTPQYTSKEPTRAEIDRMQGLVLLEFGTAWCPHCQVVQPDLADLLNESPEIQHLKIEDGKGRALGRSFRVKLWPTLVFMREGKVLKQLARPKRADIEAGLAALRA